MRLSTIGTIYMSFFLREFSNNAQLIVHTGYGFERFRRNQISHLEQIRSISRVFLIDRSLTYMYVLRDLDHVFG